MRILIACEYSGTVRDAFIARGHDAWSCDILPTQRLGPHIINDVRNVLDWEWDMMIAFPPCTYLSRAGARYWKIPERQAKAELALDFFRLLLEAPIDRIAVENPIGMTWKHIRTPDQIIQPFHFGDPVTKATCLWLKNLPPLMATLICIDPFVNWVTFGSHKHGHERSRTFQGIADAMATQWGISAQTPRNVV